MKCWKILLFPKKSRVETSLNSSFFIIPNPQLRKTAVPLKKKKNSAKNILPTLWYLYWREIENAVNAIIFVPSAILLSSAW